MSLRVLSRPGVAGVFGKLPSAGDFVRLNLPAGAASELDAWLDAGFAALEADDPDWRDDFAQAPAWRFLLPAGAAGPQPLTGVMRPSRDRAGRLFPLLAVAADETVATPPSTAWCDALETALDEAAAGGIAAEALAERVEGLGAPSAAGAGALVMRARHLGDMLFVDAEGGDGGRGDTLAAVLAAAPLPSGAGLWWRHADGRLRLIAAPGLPEGEAFAALFRAAPTTGVPAAPVDTRPAAMAG